jgi:hypothetical protein
MALNPPPLTKTAGPGIAPAVRPFAFAAVACVIVFLLFSRSGLFSKSADFSFLVLPLMAFFVLRFFSRISIVYVPGFSTYKTAAAVSGFLSGLAYAVFFYLFLDNIMLLKDVWIFPHMEGFLADISTSAGWAVLIIAGITISRLAEKITGRRWANTFFPLVTALGQFFTGLGVWQFLSAFSRESDVWINIGVVIFAGMIAVAISNIGYYAGENKSPFFTDAAQWLTHTPTLKFLIGGGITAYVVFVRPFIIDAFSYAPIVEWLIVCLIGWRLFSGIKNGIRIRCAVDVNETDWQKHVQLINNLRGADFPYLREIQEIFVADGGRDSLVIYLTLLLNNNKITPEEIHRILHPLINYQDVKIPWFAFGWEQQRVIRQNEEKRSVILGEIITNLNYILNPASRKIEEHAHEQS